jgi:hypothetical protein
VLVLSGVVTGGTQAALSGSTDNTGNTFSAGTVVLGDNDAGNALLNVANARPGVAVSQCIQLQYSGSLTASVRMYGTMTGALTSYVKVTVTRGTDPTPAFSGCGSFVADTTNYSGLGAGVLYTGTLAAFPSSYASGVVDPLASWAPGQKPSYQFTVELLDNNAAQGLSAGATFSWEARS